MNPNPNQSQDDNKKAYNKRPKWQWILIYIVLAVIVYGAVYYFFVGRKHDNSGNSNKGNSGLYNY